MAAHYDTLGVASDASPDEIKQAYRRLAMKAHPDRGGSEEAFLPIQAAYEVLSDPERRDRYDRTGEDETGSQFDQRVRDKIIELFNGMLQQEHDVFGDAISQMQDMIDRKIGTIENGRTKLEHVIKRLEKRRSRIVNRSGDDNLYTMLVDNLLTQHRATITQMNAEVEILQSAHTLLYEYEDVEPVMNGGWTTGTTFRVG